MRTDNIEKKKIHHGHNVKRLREARGIKQEVIANELDMAQPSVARLEQKEVIDDETLQKLAVILSVPVDIIKLLEEDPAAIYIENNTFESSSIIGQSVDNCDTIYNPLDKIIELANEKAALYERMLELEKEKIAWLEKLLNEKK
ncbi:MULTISPECIES: helix-turn-helix domain-containing protein [unclassified Dysgonomonas]|uniref:helix-turn-helix domain-containing protein n=1 Tax=unclassified Dysgonomonas TaxID=2630389 RepID=UPI0013EB43A6|nr:MULTISPECIES: helix-turn-helix transcriptional regulator [unclassified Dysgonomonas]